MSGCARTVREAARPPALPAVPAQPHGHLLRLSALDLRPIPSAVPSARLHSRLVCLERGYGRELAGTVELIVSELVSNAVLHGASSSGVADTPPIRLRLSSRLRGVQIEVWDGSDMMPQPRSDPPGEDEVAGGRGLVLVAALSSRWGAYRAEGGGKVIWAVIYP